MFGQLPHQTTHGEPLNPPDDEAAGAKRIDTRHRQGHLLPVHHRHPHREGHLHARHCAEQGCQAGVPTEPHTLQHCVGGAPDAPSHQCSRDPTGRVHHQFPRLRGLSVRGLSGNQVVPEAGHGTPHHHQARVAPAYQSLYQVHLPLAGPGRYGHTQRGGRVPSGTVSPGVQVPGRH